VKEIPIFFNYVDCKIFVFKVKKTSLAPCSTRFFDFVFFDFKPCVIDFEYFNSFDAYYYTLNPKKALQCNETPFIFVKTKTKNSPTILRLCVDPCFAFQNFISLDQTILKKVKKISMNNID